MEIQTFPKLYPGDIAASKGKGLLLWLSQHLLKPKTDRVHFFVIGDFIPWDNDYVILESIGKGIAVGRLSFYRPEDLEIYRVNIENWKELGRKAAAGLTRHGRARYDYLLFIEIVLGAIPLLLKGKLPPWKPEQLPYGRDAKFICTEAANEGWREAGRPIVPKGVVPTPSAFAQALQESKIQKIFPMPIKTESD